MGLVQILTKSALASNLLDLVSSMLHETRILPLLHVTVVILDVHSPVAVARSYHPEIPFIVSSPPRDDSFIYKSTCGSCILSLSLFSNSYLTIRRPRRRHLLLLWCGAFCFCCWGRRRLLLRVLIRCLLRTRLHSLDLSLRGSIGFSSTLPLNYLFEAKDFHVFALDLGACLGIGLAFPGLLSHNLLDRRGHILLPNEWLY
mmetsp:Transcript_65042/g.89398  ORF Transcript_65042/g.89398 Transcript_65042/m.89398 type:complete len:201 (+) Transcript_65042:271-873(+)